MRVYPGATHTRASHSLGVYHLAWRLLVHLAEEGADSWLSPEGVKSFLCAALLHDLGHFPYTHSLKELPLVEHEVLTGNLITSEPVKALVSAAGGDPFFARAIVDKTVDKTAGPQNASCIQDAFRARDDKELLFYRKLLSGSLDPDKLDYLSRDARYCGIPYGAQDVDFILSRLYPHIDRGVTIDSRGISGVESLLFSKYLMYRAVYWHRSVRSATAMVKKALFFGLESGSISAEDLYNLDDQGLFALAGRQSHPLFALVDSVRNGRLFFFFSEFSFDEIAHEKPPVFPTPPYIEKTLAEEISSALGRRIEADAIIIDLPEPISFESDLFVTDENCLFPESTSAFKKDVIDAFVRSLRVVRVFVNSSYEELIKPLQDKILQITQKWLKL
jgi:HD superfamily phosphohydrolase